MIIMKTKEELMKEFDLSDAVASKIIESPPKTRDAAEVYLTRREQLKSDIDGYLREKISTNTLYNYFFKIWFPTERRLERAMREMEDIELSLTRTCNLGKINELHYANLAKEKLLTNIETYNRTLSPENSTITKIINYLGSDKKDDNEWATITRDILGNPDALNIVRKLDVLDHESYPLRIELKKDVAYGFDFSFITQWFSSLMSKAGVSEKQSIVVADEATSLQTTLPSVDQDLFMEVIDEQIELVDTADIKELQKLAVATAIVRGLSDGDWYTVCQTADKYEYATRSAKFMKKTTIGPALQACESMNSPQKAMFELYEQIKPLQDLLSKNSKVSTQQKNNINELLSELRLIRLPQKESVTVANWEGNHSHLRKARKLVSNPIMEAICNGILDKIESLSDSKLDATTSAAHARTKQSLSPYIDERKTKYNMVALIDQKEHEHGIRHN